MKALFANPDLGLIGLLFFLVFFCLVSLWTFRPGAKSTYNTHAKIPLQEDGE